MSFKDMVAKAEFRLLAAVTVKNGKPKHSQYVFAVNKCSVCGTEAITNDSEAPGCPNCGGDTVAASTKKKTLEASDLMGEDFATVAICATKECRSHLIAVKETAILLSKGTDGEGTIVHCPHCSTPNKVTAKSLKALNSSAQGFGPNLAEQSQEVEDAKPASVPAPEDLKLENAQDEKADEMAAKPPASEGTETPPVESKPDGAMPDDSMEAAPPASEEDEDMPTAKPDSESIGACLANLRKPEHLTVADFGDKFDIGDSLMVVAGGAMAVIAEIVALNQDDEFIVVKHGSSKARVNLSDVYASTSPAKNKMLMAFVKNPFTSVVANEDETISINLLTAHAGKWNSKESRSKLVFAGDQWLLVSNGQTIGTIDKTDVSKDLAAKFEKPVFGSLFTEATQNGLTKQVIKDFAIKPVVATANAKFVLEDKVAKLVKERVVSAKAEELKAAFEQALEIASMGIFRGAYGESSPLVDAARKVLSGANVRNPDQLIARFLNEGIDAHNKVVISKAFEMLSMTTEAMNAQASIISTMPVAIRSSLSEASIEADPVIPTSHMPVIMAGLNGAEEAEAPRRHSWGAAARRLAVR